MAFISFFDISAMAAIARRSTVIIRSIMGVEEFHISFFVDTSSCSFCDARMGAAAIIIFVFFLISFGDEDDT